MRGGARPFEQRSVRRSSSPWENPSGIDGFEFPGSSVEPARNVWWKREICGAIRSNMWGLGRFFSVTVSCFLEHFVLIVITR